MNPIATMLIHSNLTLVGGGQASSQRYLKFRQNLQNLQNSVNPVNPVKKLVPAKAGIQKINSWQSLEFAATPRTPIDEMSEFLFCVCFSLKAKTNPEVFRGWFSFRLFSVPRVTGSASVVEEARRWTLDARRGGKGGTERQRISRRATEIAERDSA